MSGWHFGEWLKRFVKTDLGTTWATLGDYMGTTWGLLGHHYGATWAQLGHNLGTPCPSKHLKGQLGTPLNDEKVCVTFLFIPALPTPPTVSWDPPELSPIGAK